MNVPQWKKRMFTELAEQMLSELSELSEGQLRDLRGELGRYEANHAFEHEGTRKAIRLLIYVIGSLIFRI